MNAEMWDPIFEILRAEIRRRVVPVRGSCQADDRRKEGHRQRHHLTNDAFAGGGEPTIQITKRTIEAMDEIIKSPRRRAAATRW